MISKEDLEGLAPEMVAKITENALASKLFLELRQRRTNSVGIVIFAYEDGSLSLFSTVPPAQRQAILMDAAARPDSCEGQA